jgi:hypothetical protein
MVNASLGDYLVPVLAAVSTFLTANLSESVRHEANCESSGE